MSSFADLDKVKLYPKSSGQSVCIKIIDGHSGSGASNDEELDELEEELEKLEELEDDDIPLEELELELELELHPSWNFSSRALACLYASHASSSDIASASYASALSVFTVTM